MDPRTSWPRPLRAVVVAVLLAGFVASAQAAGGTPEAKEARTREVPHYESPILSLLLLPVNLLIRMTAAISPDAGRSDERSDDGRSRD